MLDTLLQYLAPHYCYGCQKIGDIICNNCKFDIVNDVAEVCVVCLTLSREGLCQNCRRHVAYTRAWAVGERQGVLQKVLDDFKFERVRAAHRSLADLLHERLPILYEDTVVVGIPTISPHIRERGYDHCQLVARRFAQLRKLTYSPAVLKRKHNNEQRGKTKAERKRQAAAMFTLGTRTDTKRPHLIIDDVFTTGATLNAAATILKNAGVQEVSIAVLARQTLD